jgi:hypothetical protein
MDGAATVSASDQASAIADTAAIARRRIRGCGFLRLVVSRDTDESSIPGIGMVGAASAGDRRATRDVIVMWGTGRI